MARNITIAGVVVDLKAESAQYVRELKKTNRLSRKWSKDVSRSFDRAKRNFAGAAAGILSASALVAGFRGATRTAREMENMARLAQMSVEDFQAAAFAADRFGVSAEKLGDMTKDVNEKLGEFIDTGGGGFKDFFDQVAPKVGLTAEELQHLSGPEVLLRMKKAMDDANVPLKQQSFYLEAVANDATLLIPMLENGGEAYRTLTEEARQANIVLSQTDLTAIRESDKILSTFGKRISTSFAKGVAGAATQIKWLAEVTGSLMESIGALYDARNDIPHTLDGIIEKEAQLNEQLQDVRKSLELLEGNGSAYNGRSRLAALNAQARTLTTQIEQLRNRRAELNLDVNITGQPELPDFNEGGEVRDSPAPVVKKARKEAEAIQAANQKIFDSLTRSLESAKEHINKVYREQVDQIGQLNLTAVQLEKTKYTSMEELRKDYLDRAKADRDQSLEDLKDTAEQEKTGTIDRMGKVIGTQGDELKQAATGWANGFSSAMTDMALKGEMDFGRMAESIVQDLIRIAIQSKITHSLLSAMGISTPGGETAPAASPPKGHATGGAVSMGTTYLVGEKGAELFTPNSSGTIIPNDRMGGNTTVNIYNQSGAQVETNRRPTPQGDVIEVMLKRVEGRMNEQISRGQGIARTLEGQYSLTRRSF
ncbi:hypothetical protein CI610_00356 [invertebrate metagenome]|uniref:Bacteriophage tail tape measure C-terminal domain-containing protein n=1 Tax=invertebrate metagenome TaxID=1711999 RepID=A0A2H9TBR7_9ZZZZ